MIDKTRNINLKVIFNITLSVGEKRYVKANEFLKDQLQGLNSFTNNEYPNCIFYSKTGGCILFSYNKNRKDFLVNYPKIWSIFENKFMLKKNIIKDIIQQLVVNTLQIEVTNIAPTMVAMGGL